MRIYIFTFFLIFAALFSQTACSRTEEPTTANKNAPVQPTIEQRSEITKTVNAEPKARLKSQANEISQTLENGNYDKLADLTHPKVLEMSGGREKMIAASKEVMDVTKKQGIEIVSTEVGEPNDFVPVGKELFSTVPFTAVLKMPNGKVKQESMVVAISGDNGANWKFVNGINQEKFQEMFPDAAGKIQIPEQSAPVPVKDK
jgi:hypothetical protein